MPAKKPRERDPAALPSVSYFTRQGSASLLATLMWNPSPSRTMPPTRWDSSLRVRVFASVLPLTWATCPRTRGRRCAAAMFCCWNQITIPRCCGTGPIRGASNSVSCPGWKPSLQRTRPRRISGAELRRAGGVCHPGASLGKHQPTCQRAGACERRTGPLRTDESVGEQATAG